MKDWEIDRLNKSLGIFVIVLCLLFIGLYGVFGYFDSNFSQDITYKAKVEQAGLKVEVKGSIYGQGEYMSVFGSCLDAFDNPIIGTTVAFSGFYPNGSVWFENDTMNSIFGQPGYYVWEGNMGLVGGTYLTKLVCTAGNQSAVALGEWQNPAWVNKIAPILEFTNQTQYLITDLNGTIVGINATTSQVLSILQNLSINASVDLSPVLNALSNLSLQISNDTNNTQIMIINGFNNTQIMLTNINGSLSAQITQGFANNTALILQQFNYTNSLINLTSSQIIQNITFLQQNMTNNFNYTNALILQTQVIANASVDRNDSYLATMMQYLVSLELNESNKLNITWIESYQYNQPVYWHDWWLRVDVYDSNGKKIKANDDIVACWATATNYPTELMDVEGEHFKTTFFVNSRDFTWSTTCSYV